MNWTLVIPRGDWLETYPTTNGRIIQGLRLAFLFVSFVLGLIVLILAVAFLGPAEKLKLVPWDVIDNFLQLLAWMIFGLIGVAAAQFVGKRATTNPETLKAVTEAKIATATGSWPVPAVVPLADLKPVLTKEDADRAAKALQVNQQNLNRGEEG